MLWSCWAMYLNALKGSGLTLFWLLAKLRGPLRLLVGLFRSYGLPEEFSRDLRGVCRFSLAPASVSMRCKCIYYALDRGSREVRWFLKDMAVIFGFEVAEFGSSLLKSSNLWVFSKSWCRIGDSRSSFYDPYSSSSWSYSPSSSIGSASTSLSHCSNSSYFRWISSFSSSLVSY